MIITKESLFEFSSRGEEERFKSFNKYILPLINYEDAGLSAKFGKYQNKMINAKTGIEIVLSYLLLQISSNDLMKFSYKLPTAKEIDIEISEIIIDSLLDIALYRSSSKPDNSDERNFYSLFIKYHNSCEALITILDGMISAMMVLYESSSLNREEKKVEIMSELVPVLMNNSDILKELVTEDYYDIWMVNFIRTIKKDIIQTIKTSDARFKSFFSEGEKVRLTLMSNEQLQVFLAAAATENHNLKEAKNLLKIRGEAEFFLNEITKLEEVTGITKEMYESSSKPHENKQNFTFNGDLNNFLKQILKFKFQRVFKKLLTIYLSPNSTIEFVNQGIAVKISSCYSPERPFFRSERTIIAQKLSKIKFTTFFTSYKSESSDDKKIFFLLKAPYNFLKSQSVNIDSYIKYVLKKYCSILSSEKLSEIFHTTIPLNITKTQSDLKQTIFDIANSRGTITNRLASFFEDAKMKKEIRIAYELKNFSKESKEKILEEDLMDLELISELHIIKSVCKRY